MELRTIVFLIYIIIALFFIIFSEKISIFLYRLVLMYTDKLNMKELFYFKVNGVNRDSLFLIAKIVVIVMGLMLFFGSILALCFSNL